VELDKNIEQELAELIADPEKVSTQHTAMLNELLQEYPYYQPLHLLLAKANRDTAENSGLTKASLYTNGQTLHRFLFEKISPAASGISENPSVIGEELQVVTDEQETFEEISEPIHVVQPGNSFAEKDHPADTPLNDEQETFEEISEPYTVVQVETTRTETAEEFTARDQFSLNDEQEIFEEISEPLPVVQVETSRTETEEDFTAHQQFPINDEQETFEEISELGAVLQRDTVRVSDENVFEEIGEVDFNTYRPFRNAPGAGHSGEEEQPSEAEDPVEPGDTASESGGSAEETELNPEPAQPKLSAEDELVFESIVSSDFFAFENNFSSIEKVEEPKAEIIPPYIEEHDEAAAAEAERNAISNYHDENLPYTFLWWLAKTRKEHQRTFQPYAMPKKQGSQELQHQYVEHIFHLQSHLTGNDSLLDNPEQSKPVSRDFEIIESFIKNDPQITPPNAEQIDNENKARKSAEDQNDLVSETLANIYIEQMLYDKAIDTYEKLSLKFPEKRRYFADLIQSIEKKI
jgi:hypothetical protein